MDEEEEKRRRRKRGTRTRETEEEEEEEEEVEDVGGEVRPAQCNPKARAQRRDRVNHPWNHSMPSHLRTIKARSGA